MCSQRACMVMAVSVGSLPALSSSRDRVQNCGNIFRGSAAANVGQCKFVCRICCSRRRHGSTFKKYARQPFRDSTIEDALITSWALYDYDVKKNKSASSKPTSQTESSHQTGHKHENSEAQTDDHQPTVFVADAQERKGRRNPRASNPSLSLSQSFDGQNNGGYIMEAMGHPAAMSKPLAGGAGLYMALVFALLGITTAGASLLGINSSQEECTKCSGYGVERCHLCQCTGTIKFEGQFVHIIPCPLCLGSKMKKCSSCDGVRIKKGVPPFLQDEQIRSSRRSSN